MTNDSYQRLLRRHIKLVDGRPSFEQLPRSITPASVDRIDFQSQVPGPASTPIRTLSLTADLTRSQLSASVRPVIRRGSIDDFGDDEAHFTCGLYRADFIAEVKRALCTYGVAFTSEERHAADYLHFENQHHDLLALASVVVRESTTFSIRDITVMYRS